jgi:hypothetical protein
MSKVRVDPLTSLVRFYVDDINPSSPLSIMSEPYYKTLILSYLDNGSVRISGAVQSLTFNELKELKKNLKESGYTSLQWRHNGKEQSFKL